MGGGSRGDCVTWDGFRWGGGARGGTGAQRGAVAPLTGPCGHSHTVHAHVLFALLNGSGRPRRRPWPSAHFHHHLIARPKGPGYASGRSQHETGKRGDYVREHSYNIYRRQAVKKKERKKKKSIAPSVSAICGTRKRAYVDADG